MIRILALLTGLVAAGAALAQGIVDPTRPPGGLAEAAETAATGGPVLQSVMLSPSRKIAVISGEMVAVGGRYGSSRLVSLTETEAVLKNGSETTVLKLHPQVEKRATGPDAKGARKTAK